MKTQIANQIHVLLRGMDTETGVALLLFVASERIRMTNNVSLLEAFDMLTETLEGTKSALKERPES